MHFNLGTHGYAVLRFVLSAQNMSHKNPYQNRIPVLIGFYCLQSRPSLWNPILRNLEAAFALQITVRVPGLWPGRAIVIYTGNRGGGKPPPYEDKRNFALACRERS